MNGRNLEGKSNIETVMMPVEAYRKLLLPIGNILSKYKATRDYAVAYLTFYGVRPTKNSLTVFTLEDDIENGYRRIGSAHPKLPQGLASTVYAHLKKLGVSDLFGLVDLTESHKMELNGRVVHMIKHPKKKGVFILAWEHTILELRYSEEGGGPFNPGAKCCVCTDWCGELGKNFECCGWGYVSCNDAFGIISKLML